MAYSDAMTLRQQGAGIAGVAAVHAGLGALIVLGLAATVVIDPKPEEDTFEATNIWSPPPPPPEDVIEPDKPKPKIAAPEVKDPAIPPIVIPPSPFSPPDTGPRMGTFDPVIPNLGSGGLGDIGLGSGGGGALSDFKPTPTPTPTPTLAFNPVSASPRNNASRWVTDSDYKSSWIRREMAGVAKFSLGVGTNGRVTDCRVTSSTGYDALDNATCKLIAKRARFTPAKDGSGKTVEGSFSSSIRWNLPD
ncbi:MAG: energy transducer TonB [Erythrobacter sp.]